MILVGATLVTPTFQKFAPFLLSLSLSLKLLSVRFVSFALHPFVFINHHITSKFLDLSLCYFYQTLG